MQSRSLTGRKYAGENFNGVLKQRDSESGPSIQMCDALLSRSLPEEFEVILSNRNAHAGHELCDIAPSLPDGAGSVSRRTAMPIRMPIGMTICQEAGDVSRKRLAFRQT